MILFLGNLAIPELIVLLSVSLLLLIFPLWKIYTKAGLNPLHSLWALIPGIGVPISLFILMGSTWKQNGQEHP